MYNPVTSVTDVKGTLNRQMTEQGYDMECMWMYEVNMHFDCTIWFVMTRFVFSTLCDLGFLSPPGQQAVGHSRCPPGICLYRFAASTFIRTVA